MLIAGTIRSQVVSRMDSAALSLVCALFQEGLEKLFREAQDKLRASMAVLDRRVKEAEAGAASKFLTFKMSCGSIADFHMGLGARVGTRTSPITTKPMMMLCGYQQACPHLF